MSKLNYFLLNEFNTLIKLSDLKNLYYISLTNVKEYCLENDITYDQPIIIDYIKHIGFKRDSKKGLVENTPRVWVKATHD